MAQNPTPYDFDRIVKALNKAYGGLLTDEVTVGIGQNTAVKVKADRDLLAGTPAGPGNIPPAVPGLKTKWTAAKKAKTDSTEAIDDAKEAGRTLARTCVAVLKPRLGDRWNSAWNAVGFNNGTLRIPDDPSTVLGHLRDYFGLNPTHAVADVGGIACTAAACEAAIQAISDANTASAQANTAAGQAQAALEAGIQAGRRRLTGLREELDQLLDDDDDRWYLFGFDKPSDPDGPEVPANLIATPGAAGTKMIFLDWDDARRGRSYRVIILDANGVEVFNKIYKDSEATVTLSDLASGTQVTVKVTARNVDGEESQPGEPITVAVP